MWQNITENCWTSTKVRIFVIFFARNLLGLTPNVGVIISSREIAKVSHFFYVFPRKFRGKISHKNYWTSTKVRIFVIFFFREISYFLNCKTLTFFTSSLRHFVEKYAIKIIELLQKYEFSWYFFAKFLIS